MIKENKLQEAVKLFGLNIEEYPESALAYDNCGEGRMMIGQTNKTIKIYERSLLLNPDNENVKEMLKVLNKQKISIGSIGNIVKTKKIYKEAIWGLFILISLNGFSQAQIDNPVKNFEKLWHDFNDHYAFFDIRNVDWEETYQKYRPMANEKTTNDSLFSICCEMLRQFDDRHISLVDVENSKKCNTGSPIRLLKEFPNNSSLKLLVQTIDTTLMKYQFKDLTRLKTDIPYLFGNIIEYTDNGRYGYLRINLMIGISKEELNEVLDNAVDSFRYAKGVIIDIRFNSGGYDENSYNIAGRFVDKKRIGHFKSPKTKSGFTDLEKKYLKPTGKNQIVKPIVLITSDQSMSAADVFALIMRELPYVTIIGDNTKGIFSDINELKLPNGWSYTFSSQKYLSTDMKNFEGVGISPDIKILNTMKDVKNGIDPILLKALEVLDDKTSNK